MCVNHILVHMTDMSIANFGIFCGVGWGGCLELVPHGHQGGMTK